MQNSAKVFLRAEKTFKEICITSEDKPDVDKNFTDRWQKIIDLIAKIFHIPAALIMQVTHESMNVFLASNNKDNPYREGSDEHLGCGLYCETVLGKNDELLIKNALNNNEWKDNPDIKLNMISYYGLPLKWPDGEFFGTICILDNKENAFEKEYKELLYEFKLAVERDLELLCDQQKLIYYAEMDILTSTYNRGKIEAILKSEFARAKRYKTTFSVAIMDINDLKQINDKHGHNNGDEVLKAFARGINSRIRGTDYFGRWGGDEFMLLCPNTNLFESEKLISGIKQAVAEEMNKTVEYFGFCYGISRFEESDKNYQDIVKRADDGMYKCKENQIV